MRASTVFRGAHALVTIILLVVVVGFVWMRGGDRKTGDEFLSARQVQPGLWLYATQNRTGNATVPTVIRYDLSARQPDNPNDAVKLLHDQWPFMEGTGEITSITSEHDYLRISYRGRVYSLDPTATWQDEGKPVTMRLAYDIQ
ncbi:hypothetical protein [Kosakonia sp. MUSA4]|uniref:hypothetical protein n=1 Tax=Kosakonia sp. MUSA4 TaxID=2067958 RepID=UPI00159B1EA2|nr:hypothetical protein [Kosakonia sp. MUSA4]QJT80842.1 hypothetical protein C0557_12530 [Kosakonia sp. MUSA4]